MQLTFMKKALFPYLDVSLPRSMDPTVTISFQQGQPTLQIHDATLSLVVPFEGEFIEASPLTCTFSSLKKGLQAAKAKEPIQWAGLHLLQGGVSIGSVKPVAPPPNPLSFATSTDLGRWDGKALAASLFPLTLFHTNDPLHPWRSRVACSPHAQDVQITTSDGIHLACWTTYRTHPVSGVSSPFGFSNTLFALGLKWISLFSTGILAYGDQQMTFRTSPTSYLLLQGEPCSFPPLLLPQGTTSCTFMLNPFQEGKKIVPFEKKYQETLRAYRDATLTTYEDLEITFEVTPATPQYWTVTTKVRHGQAPWTPLLTTTSPFFHGTIPPSLLPAYPVGKALGAMEDITSLQYTEHGLHLVRAQTNVPITQTDVFLHGIRPS